MNTITKADIDRFKELYIKIAKASEQLGNRYFEEVIKVDPYIRWCKEEKGFMYLSNIGPTRYDPNGPLKLNYVLQGEETSCTGYTDVPIHYLYNTKAFESKVRAVKKRIRGCNGY